MSERATGSWFSRMWRGIGGNLRGLAVLIRAGVVRPMGPVKLTRVLRAYRRFGITLGFGFVVGAIKHPGRAAIVDERGTVSYRELDERTTRLAHGLRELGPDEVIIGLLCRNHRGAVETCLAAAKAGADVVLLNTSLSAKQLGAVVVEQRIGVLVVDDELLPSTVECLPSVSCIAAWTDAGPPDRPSLDTLIATAPGEPLPAPRRPGRTVVLTSGTTGTPKGARRPEARSLVPIASMLSRVPLRDGDVMQIAPPLFHILAFGYLQLGVVVGSTFVLRRKFDPASALHDAAANRVSVLVAPPVMLQRILELPGVREAASAVDALRVVPCGGSALPGPLATRFMAVFGPVLYNLYGSTEVSWATIAGPEDLADAPGTAGRPPWGTAVAILDAEGNPVSHGEVGRIFVGNDLLFDGYTRPGVAKEVHDGLMSTGDLGYFDEAGRLFVSGREDDMIISGGENVFPREVEDLLAAHHAVREVVAVGVPDIEYGQRLAAYLVLADGATLSPDEVREHVKQHLAKFSVPRDVVFVPELPRNPAGKVLVRELPGFGAARSE